MAKEKLIHRRDLVLCATVIVNAINEAIELLTFWEQPENAWAQDAIRLHNEGLNWYQIGKVLEQDPRHVRSQATRYQTACLQGKSVLDWIVSHESDWVFDMIGSNSEQCIEVIEALAYGKRQLGVDEPDIPYLDVPRLRSIRSVKHMHLMRGYVEKSVGVGPTIRY